MTLTAVPTPAPPTPAVWAPRGLSSHAIFTPRYVRSGPARDAALRVPRDARWSRVVNYRRHQRTRDVVSLVFYTLLENLGYRQINDLWRMLAFVDLARRKQGWGAQKRRGIGNLSTAEAPARQPLTKSQ